LRKQVLVSVDRGETRVALLEAPGDPGATRSASVRRRRRTKTPTAGFHVAELYV
jgi:ribonuclease G